MLVLATLVLLLCCSLLSTPLLVLSILRNRARKSAPSRTNRGKTPPGNAGCSSALHEYKASPCTTGWSPSGCSDPKRACARLQDVAVYGKHTSKLFGSVDNVVVKHRCKDGSYLSSLKTFNDQGKVMALNGTCSDPVYNIDVPLKATLSGGIGKTEKGPSAGGIISGIIADLTVGNYWGDGSSSFTAQGLDGAYSGVKSVDVRYDPDTIYDIRYHTYDNRTFTHPNATSTSGKSERFTCPKGKRLTGVHTVTDPKNKQLRGVQFECDSTLAYNGF